MNLIVERNWTSYKKMREEANYCILHIENYLEMLAKEGVIWTLLNMPELSRGEDILVAHYLQNFWDIQQFEYIPQ